MRTGLLASLLLAPLLVGAAGDSSAWSRAGDPFAAVADGRTVRVSGVIRPGDVARFRAALTDKVRVVSLNSAGGEPVAAMDVAEVIEQRKLAVRVEGVCAGACATYLFAAGAKREVASGSLLLWDAAALAGSFRADVGGQVTKLLGASGRTPAEIETIIEREDVRLKGWIARQDALYARQGLKPAILYAAARTPPEQRAVLAAGPENAPTLIHVAPAALRCAGFGKKVGEVPKDWPGAAARLGLDGVTLVRDPALEAALCP